MGLSAACTSLAIFDSASLPRRTRIVGDMGGPSRLLSDLRLCAVVFVESLRRALHNPLMTLPHPELWRESLLAMLYWPALSPRCRVRLRSSVTMLLALPGRACEGEYSLGAVAKCGIVASGVMVVVVAALLFLVLKSLPGIGRSIVLMEPVSDGRLSWPLSML